MNWPLRPGPRYNEFGGSFIYPMGEDKLCIGMVAGLDTTDTFSCHDLLQQLKTHLFVRDLLEGGKRVGWGAKTIPSGGYWSMPRKLAVPGMVMCGDNVSMCNIPYLGQDPLRHARGHLRGGGHRREPREGPRLRELRGPRETRPLLRYREGPLQMRNVRQHGDKGPRLGAIATRGCSPAAPCRPATRPPSSTRTSSCSSATPRTAIPRPTASTSSTSSRRSSSRATRLGTTLRTTSGSSRTPREIAQTWVSMCPAQVYEIPEDQRESNAPEVEVHVTASNRVQCGAITAKGGRLTPRGRRRAPLPGNPIAAHEPASAGYSLGAGAIDGCSVLHAQPGGRTWDRRR